MEHKFCPHYLKVAFTTTGAKHADMTRLRCKQWSCEFCRQVNAKIWYMFLKERLPDVCDTWYLVTLTASDMTRGMCESLENIRQRIDILIKRMKRVFGDDIEYVRVYERHPTSEAIHAHLIMSGLTPFVQWGYSVKHVLQAIGVLTRSKNGCWAVKSWLKKTCSNIGMGYIADVQRIVSDTGNVVKYACKYLFKDQNIDVPYLRHVQTSRGIGKPSFEKSGKKWETALYIEAKMFPPNTAITDMNTKFVVDNNYWELQRLYPMDDLQK